jgi:hypothetical protein
VLTSRGQRGRGRAVQVAPAAPGPQPKRPRKRITDPVILEKRGAALAKARVALAERWARRDDTTISC